MFKMSLEYEKYQMSVHITHNTIIIFIFPLQLDRHFCGDAEDAGAAGVDVKFPRGHDDGVVVGALG